MTIDLYRPCVGICLINNKGLVFAAERHNFKGAWQMPQGGIDDGEDVLAAAKRELYEETNIKSASLITIMPDTIRYNLPPDLQGKLWGGKYKGQEQSWVAMRFDGDDSEININAHEPIEFTQWKWVEIDTLPDLIVPFKRDVYARVIAAFKPLTRA